MMLKEKPYVYDTIALPHDAVKKDGIIVENSYKSEFTRLFAHTGTKIIVLPRTAKNVGIGNSVNKTRNTVFVERKTKEYITALSKYRKKWSEQLGRYLDDPYHDINSDYADSYRYAQQLADLIEKRGTASGALERHRETVASRSQRM